MGIFGGLLKGIAGSIPIIGPAITGASNKKAISKASAAEIAAMNRAIDTQNQQYAATTAAYAPYTSAGAGAIGAMGDLTGLNGGDKWTAALAALQSSPELQSLYRNGDEAVLQNASATGGLRGGNVNRSLADFHADTFAKMIQQQLANLGGIAGIGSGLTTNLGGLGANNASNVAGLQVGQGQAQSGAILGRQAVQNDLTRQITQQIQQLASMFAGGAGGGLSSAGPSFLSASLPAAQPDPSALLQSMGHVF